MNNSDNSDHIFYVHTDNVHIGSLIEFDAISQHEQIYMNVENDNCSLWSVSNEIKNSKCNVLLLGYCVIK